MIMCFVLLADCECTLVVNTRRNLKSASACSFLFLLLTQAERPTLCLLFCAVHPFHIHVNPFQVVAVNAGLVPGMLPGNLSLAEVVQQTNTKPSLMWRDTVFIPPYGQTMIYQRFGLNTAFAGTLKKKRGSSTVSSRNDTGAPSHKNSLHLHKLGLQVKLSFTVTFSITKIKG